MVRLVRISKLSMQEIKQKEAALESAMEPDGGGSEGGWRIVVDKMQEADALAQVSDQVELNGGCRRRAAGAVQILFRCDEPLGGMLPRG